MKDKKLGLFSRLFNTSEGENVVEEVDVIEIIEEKFKEAQEANKTNELQIQIINQTIETLSDKFEEIEELKTQNFNLIVENQKLESNIKRLQVNQENLEDITTKSITGLFETIEMISNKEVVKPEKVEKFEKVDRSEKIDNKYLIKIGEDFLQLKQQFQSVLKKNEENNNISQNKVEQLENKFSALVEVITDKITEEPVPQQLRSEFCPYKRKNTKCELWSTRKNKFDALSYCLPCMLSFINKDKGF